MSFYLKYFIFAETTREKKRTLAMEEDSWYVERMDDKPVKR